MAIVDERGRLGGKVNLIDAVVAFLILILIPVAFGAYLLFRTPAPSGVTIRAGAETIRVPLTGQTDLPATLRVQCFVVTTGEGALKCVVPGAVQQADVAPGSALSLAAPDRAWATFQIDEVRK